jgi:predicted NAD/FAD-binding protein
MGCRSPGTEQMPDRADQGVLRDADRRKVAVIGSRIAGLTAAYVLRTCCDVTLFESEARLGGHADTHRITASLGAVW